MKEVRGREIDGSSSSVGLLVSILVRYPEICTVSYVPDARSLEFSFMVARALKPEEFEDFRTRALSSISVYLHLLRLEQAPVAKIAACYIDGITQIQMTRDVSTLTGEEISLLIGLVLEAFGEDLIKDRSDALEEEEMEVQEEFIENLLADLKETMQEKKLIGYREEGRVVVFNRPLGSS
ncbi:MAG: hypothetical protein NUW23_06125 [Firmicutes bacterium]|nr:hypothetical protein [Bacillota bacterium]